MVAGVITNYKYFEDNLKREFGHFYEIKDSENNFYYAKVKKEYDERLSICFGAEVELQSQEISTDTKISITTTPDLIHGPFNAKFDVINYRGFVLDCIDSDIGVYNLDNEIILFGSGCLELHCGSEVVLYNLHLVPLNGNGSTNWIFKLFGRSLKASSHILVYCPSFSSSLSGDSVLYDNLIQTRSDFSSLIYTNDWLKTKGHEFPGFQALDDLAASLVDNGSNRPGSIFIGHCSDCAFTAEIADFSDLLSCKTLLNGRELKNQFYATKQKLFDEMDHTESNLINCHSSESKNEILFGIITRKTPILYDVRSGDTSVSVFCRDPNFAPPENELIFIFNFLKIVELVPRLKIPNSFTTKAYIWLIPGECKIWSTTGFSWELSACNPTGFVQCTLVRKYLILKNSNDSSVQNETTVLSINSPFGPRTFHLNPEEKFYSIIANNESKTEMFCRIPSIFVHEKYFSKAEDVDSICIIMSGNDIIPSMNYHCNFVSTDGFIKIKVSDLSYLAHLNGVQFFTLKLRFYSISSLSLKLSCSKCKSLVEGNRCLIHYENYSPMVSLNAVFEAADLSDGSKCNVLIDRISDFEMILQRKGTVEALVNFAKISGAIKLSSNSFCFLNSLKNSTDDSDNSTVELKIVQLLLPLISGTFSCTFPFSTRSSILRPNNIEKLESKLEILNVLQYFKSKNGNT